MTSNPKTIHIGIVGCGAITREFHLRLLQETEGVEIAFLCDKFKKNADLARCEFGLDADVSDNVADMEDAIDAALVAVPPRFHAPVTLQLLKMGVDVFCEKPLAVTAAEGEQMADAAEEADRILAVGHMTRFFPVNNLLRTFIKDPLLGEVQEVVAESGGQLGWTMTTDAYFNKAMTGGGVFFDAGVHLLDRILWLFGDLEDVAYEDDAYEGVEANANLSGTLNIADRPVPCRMAFSWTHQLKNSIRIVGSAGTIESRLNDQNNLVLKRSVDGKLLDMLIQNEARAVNPFEEQMKDFFDAVRRRRPPFVSARSAIKVLRLIETAYSRRTRIPQPWVETAV